MNGEKKAGGERSAVRRTPGRRKERSAATPRNGSHPACRKKVSLALQGGGSHGAFTWGVIDRILEDDRLDIEAFVGTSAGALNAAVAAYGMETGGPEKSRELLKFFWESNISMAKKSVFQPTWIDMMTTRGNLEHSPLWLFFDMLTRVYSPYQWNPANINPFKDIILETVDFERLREAEKVKVFVCATNVLNGRLRVFETHEISPEAVLASACLPFLYHAVEVDGDFYWDGGYMGNPPIFPVIYGTQCADVLIVQINPINIPEVPTTAPEILDRMNTLSFNSSLMREMRAIDFVSRLITEENLDTARYKRTFIHTIDAEEEFSKLSASSKLNLDRDFVLYLFETGRRMAEDFLARHFDAIGRESSTNIREKFF
ncbi:MAG: patatin-like phospholipase family protein [Syntrophales bacterium]|nr:patatin-like phospholipase family protein [Syntrophales bacterium]MCK9528175.1 patatin-like phospholipase family protein [Syntrophales bacterium]MDX9921145.1 patatin-like phospholipase family protein [Syntrophales bacterium]